MPYDPPRQSHPKPPKDPLEIELVFNIRPCSTCNFLWPEDSSNQPYGPYPCYDFHSNTPAEKDPEGKTNSFVWLKGITRPPAFPDAEVMDGCRKAPIMTVGINPNLTAFATGRTGASWCYPSFSSADGCDSWTKYAYYYRYRSVYQEHFDLKFIDQFLLPEGQIRAEKPGVLMELPRSSDAASYEIRVQYDGDAIPTAIHLPGKLGEPRYVVLVDANARFVKGDLLAARLNVPAGRNTDIYAEPIGYYMQMVPVLQIFESYLKQRGHPSAHLQIGEDVGQVDMVACASPHWGPQWLGGNSQSVNTIISNCVHKNAWAMKQLVQTRPAILFVVGQASWDMFRKSFGHLIKAQPPLPPYPEDGPYTLLRLTTQQDCRLEFSTQIKGQAFNMSTRLVITPHFSYNENFVPQFRMSPEAFESFEKVYPSAAAFLQKDPRIKFQKQPGSFITAGIQKDALEVLAEIKQKYSSASAHLMTGYYDAHQMMAAVLKHLYENGGLSYTNSKGGSPGFLTRGDGPCTFCVNSHWKFPKGCPYGKPDEKQYPVGFLEQVTREMVGSGNAAGASS
jgi:hypothetical protein